MRSVIWGRVCAGGGAGFGRGGFGGRLRDGGGGRTRAGGRGTGGFGGGVASAGAGATPTRRRSAWVEAHFTATTVGGMTVYNLTATPR
jgi:hypothetical protein